MRVIRLLLAIVAAVAIAGCSSDEGDDETVSRAEPTRVATKRTPTPHPAATRAPRVAFDCDAYDSWIWAQTVHEDEGGDDVVCRNKTLGFAPFMRYDSIPPDAVPATLTWVTDGDTIGAFVGGTQEQVRLYQIDAPETSDWGGGLECGGHEATAYLEWVLGFAPGGTIYLQFDATHYDRYDRRLAWVWFELAPGEVYLANEIMVRSGFARQSVYEPDVMYRAAIAEAESFARRHRLGGLAAC